MPGRSREWARLRRGARTHLAVLPHTCVRAPGRGRAHSRDLPGIVNELRGRASSEGSQLYIGVERVGGRRRVGRQAWRQGRLNGVVTTPQGRGRERERDRAFHERPPPRAGGVRATGIVAPTPQNQDRDREVTSTVADGVRSWRRRNGMS